jgi:Holliday junction resolvase RusA-like endonuclease
MGSSMPKRPLKLTIRIPNYAAPRNRWRKAIHRAVAEQQKNTLVKYEPDDKLEIVLWLYFDKERATLIHDVDNRLKDCLDALQGRVGGPKGERKTETEVLCAT